MVATDTTHDAGLLVRIDAIAVAVTHVSPEGTRYSVSPVGTVHAANASTLPVFSSWTSRGNVVVRLRGQATAAFDAQLSLGGERLGTPVHVVVEALTGDFAVELTIALSALPGGAATGKPVKLALVVSPGLRSMTLTQLGLLPLQGNAPTVSTFDVREHTDTLLYNAPERRLFDLQNPEEGFWLGTGTWRLKVVAEWNNLRGESGSAGGWELDTNAGRVHHVHRAADVAAEILKELPDERIGGSASIAGYAFDTGHPTLRMKTPPQGMDVPVLFTSEHALTFGKTAGSSGNSVVFSWSRDFALRVRDPLPSLSAFKRLSAVGVDFGTSATVAATTQRGFRSLLRLGSPAEGGSPAENPTWLLIEDHQALWEVLAQYGEGMPEGFRRYPPLAGLVRASHSAREAIAQTPNAAVGEIKSLPERVVLLDQSPLLRDRKKGSDFLLDEARVRALVRAYAFVLGRAINRPGQDVFLHYWLTYPAEFDDRSRAMLEEELRAGLLLSIPEGIPSAEVSVEMRATEPEAYAAEVCPELVSHPELEELVGRFGELRFAVFDFGGGTLDIACGRYRPATAAEEAASGCSSVIETLQVGGNDHLGGDYLTHELAWMAHQHETVLPEMESKQVPMQRPPTVPENRLARAPHLYKRSLAGRQNKIRFERELQLEQLKFTRNARIAQVAKLSVTRIDNADVQVESFGQEPASLQKRLAAHLEERIQEGARLLASMLQSTPWNNGQQAAGDWREQGVLILLAGNSSRGEYVASAIGKALGIPELKVWKPDGSGGPMQGVVLYETAPRMERGVELAGTTPKTAVALGALKIANREVHLVRAQQGFSYFVGDMRGFPPKFHALIPMGALPAHAEEWGPHYVEFGTWDAQKPLRVSKEYVAGKMTSSDPRLLTIPTGLPPGSSGKLFVCVTAPTKIALHLQLADGERFVRTELNLAPYLS